jgi:hypothetical protein
MHESVRSFVDGLGDTSRWKEHQDQVNAWVASGETELLLEAIEELDARGGESRGDPLSSMRTSVVRGLALVPGEASASAALHMARAKDHREIASILAFAQPLDAIAALVERRRAEHVEALACLVQECVLRHGRLEGEPYASFWTELDAVGHPLAWLPLRTFEPERSLSLSGHAAFGASFPIPFGPSSGRTSGDPVGTDDVVAPAIVADEQALLDAEAALGCVVAWKDRSNGTIGCWAFALDPGRPTSLAGSLEGLGLDCLAGAPPPAVGDQAVDRAFDVLFAAASSGGAYPSGAFGAYGRLLAWRSAGTLADAPPGSGFDDVEQQVLTSRWCWFESYSAWYHAVAWDVGLVAIRPDERSIAILAATDTD